MSAASPLPLPLRAWSRIGRRCAIGQRLRISRALTQRLIASGRTYDAADGLRFSIDRDDPFQATMLVGLYDTVAAAMLRRFAPAGATVVDAGAHLGYFSLRLGRWVGPAGAVHSFECDPRLVPRLRRHVELNALPWITVNACGLLDRAVDAHPLYLPSQLGWSSTLEGAWGATESAVVAMTTLDDYVDARGLDPSAITLIKLDVEGAELAALHGARRTLAASSAAVLLEFLPDRIRAQGQDPADLVALMEGLGFAPWVPAPAPRGFRLIPGIAPQIGEDVLFLRSTTGRGMSRD